ncbi:MAG: metallophosphoesterase [Rikenellaceae bacterium]|nr:metallophosphoesterase [Rikenellaceae bacterium]
MKAMFIVMPLIYLGGSGYLLWRTWSLVAGAPLWLRILYVLFYAVVSMSLFISIGARDAALPEWLLGGMFRVGSVWILLMFYMIMALTLCDVVGWVVPSFHAKLPVAFALTLAVMLYGYINYRNPRIERIDISLDKPIENEALKIVAVSDVHLGYGTGKRDLQRYVEMINREMPDVVLIVGDLIDNSIAPVRRARMQEELSQIEAPHGVFLVLGNHEYISGAESCIEFLKQTPIRVLRDSVATLPSGVQIVGRDDRMNRNRLSLEELLSKCDPARPIVLLDHQPYDLAASDAAAVELQISGHTHHGQVFPLNIVTDMMYEQSHGYRKWQHSHIFVLSGLSLWGPPFRIGTRSDMAVITLK